MHEVRIAEGPEFRCADDDTLLRAGLRAGLGMPYECNSGSCGTCKVAMMLGFDTQMVDPGTGAGELITIQYRFTDISGANGTCQFTVYPDLTIAVGP